MTNPTVRIHNTETDEVIDREMTEAEFAQWQAEKAKNDAETEAAALLPSKKAALLDRLGISEDEARLLLS
jgi:hypothetical protein